MKTNRMNWITFVIAFMVVAIIGVIFYFTGNVIN